MNCRMIGNLHIPITDLDIRFQVRAVPDSPFGDTTGASPPNLAKGTSTVAALVARIDTAWPHIA